MPNIIRLWVYDRPGVLDRITGLIRRHGVNIKTLTAGDTQDGVSQITISLGDNVNIKPFGDSLSEMSSIQTWEKCTPESHLIRELILMRFKRGQEALLPKDCRIVKEEGDLIFAEHVTSPSQIDELIKTLRPNNIVCVRAGAVGLALSEGAI